MKKIGLTLLACCLVAMLTGQGAFGMSSANFRVDDDVLSSGGGDAASPNYSNYSTFGQPVADVSSSSTNYSNASGFLAVDPIFWRLQVTTAGTGTGTVSIDTGTLAWSGNTGTSYYVDGANVSLTATPGTNSDFTGWSGACSGTGSCMISMGTNTAAIATFARNAYVISTAVSAGSGTVICSPNPVSANRSSTCFITPSFGYQTIGVIVDGSSVGSPAAYPFTNVTADHVISASFGVITYSLNVITAGTGTGKVTSSPAGINCGATCSSGFAAGTPVILTAATTTGSTFMGWSGACTGSGSCIVSMLTTTTVTATFNDTTPPVLVISALPDGSFTNNPTFSMNGTVKDNIGVQSLVISGATVTVQSDHSFTYALVLSTGTNTITTVATDLAGSQATDTRIITLDQTAPSLTITTPADNSYTNQATNTLAGTVEAGATLVRSLNSGPTVTIVYSGATYTESLNLASGTNTINVTAGDPAGNTNTLHRTITFDNASPSLAIEQPPHDTISSSATITISGTVSDLTAVSLLVTCPTASVGVVSTPTPTTWSVVLTNLQQGTNSITVTAADQAGNTGRATRNIIFNTGFGDVNNSGGVDIGDAVMCFRYVLGRIQLTPDQLMQCDVAPLGADGKPQPDGRVDIGDVIIIIRKVIGLGNW
jgi:hypothetical protein